MHVHGGGSESTSLSAATDPTAATRRTTRRPQRLNPCPAGWRLDARSK